MDCFVPAQMFGSFRRSISNIPGDKSISHRAVILGSLSESVCEFENFLTAEDCLNTVEIFRQLGVRIERQGAFLRVHGVGLRGLAAPSKILDAGNSGTGIRLISGVLAAQQFDSEITGDASIQKRPMKRIVEPLSKMGAGISGFERNGNIYPPLRIRGSLLQPVDYTLPVASAQVKSALLLASLFCQQESRIGEPEKCRDHTEKMLELFGADFRTQGTTLICSGKKPLRAPKGRIVIPSDVSSAAFFVVLALLVPGSELKLDHVGLNPTRNRILTLLREMGGNISIENARGVEPLGDVTVWSSGLKNGVVEPKDMPNLIDEIPILAVAGLFGKGVLKVSGAKELRVKESDRIAAIGRLARAMGGTIHEFEDGFELEGPKEFRDFEVDSFGDHRIAMSAIVGAVASGKKATVRNVECIATSFPNFFEILEKLGVAFETGLTN